MVIRTLSTSKRFWLVLGLITLSAPRTIAQETGEGLGGQPQDLIGIEATDGTGAALVDEGPDVTVTPDGIIEMHIQGGDLYVVLKELLLKSRRNIVFGEDVQGTVSVSLFDVSMEEALDAVLKPNGFAYREEGNFIYIYTREELDRIIESERVTVTRMYRLNYISPADAQILLQPFLTPEVGEIITGPPAGSGLEPGGSAQSLAIEDLIIVTDYAEIQEEIKKNLTFIDKRPKQVLVEVTILSATLNENNAMGIDFNLVGGVNFDVVAAAAGRTGVQINGPNVTVSASSGTTNSQTGSGGQTGTGNLNSNRGGLGFQGLTNVVPPSKLNDVTGGASTQFAGNVPTGGISVGLVTDDISIFIRALEAVTDVVILSNVKLPSLNKQAGHVLVGSRDGYLTSSVVTETSTTQSIAFLETGTQLRFRPFITNDGYVRMEVTPSDSTGGVNANGLPFERTTQVTTNIIVKDGRTILIGGLFRDVTSTGRSQVPGLGDLPLLGPLFRSTSDTTIREEVIILLTVHIIDDESDYADYSEEVLDDVERLRVGIREGLQAHGRERLAQSHYHSALNYATAGDDEMALWHVKLAIHNRPTFLDAIKLREELIGQRAWDNEGAATRNFLKNLILREQGLPPQNFDRPLMPDQPQAETNEAEQSSEQEADQEDEQDRVENKCPNDPLKTEPGICGCGVPDEDTDEDGTADCQDECPNDPEKTAAGGCGCGTPDTDSDGDGTPDCKDGCPQDDSKVAPGVCGCGTADIDTDGDEVEDCKDECPEDAKKVAPGQCGCGIADTDTDGDGTPDCQDKCPDDAKKTDPGQCGCGILDTDSDADKTPDCSDLCPNDPQKTVPGQCGCGTSDADSDKDGTPDCLDKCPSDPNKKAPGQCGCGTPDTDSDRDGTPNCKDECPSDPKKTAPGQCGCGTADTDTDGDGTPNCLDKCPRDPDKIAAGECGCGTPDVDADGDGVPNCKDECPSDPKKTAPGQCGCGTPDTDTDGDGTPDCLDECPKDPSKKSPGVCGCGTPDADSDGDGTPDCADDCPNDASKKSPGQCGCGTPDVDSDGDGAPDCLDKCPSDPGKQAPGQCGCGTPDTDTDGDGIPDCLDKCPNDPDKKAPGQCGCGTPDTDSDGDGTPDCKDECPKDPQKIAPGKCGCGQPDTDTDGDGSPDCQDKCPTDPNKTASGACGCGELDVDTDGDLTPDCVDGCPNDLAKASPGRCGCGIAEVTSDLDEDGTIDCLDECPSDPSKIVAGQCGCGLPDIDSDGDGIAYCNDLCPSDPRKVKPGQCGCASSDVDSDFDGIADCRDGCPRDPQKLEPGHRGCGNPERLLDALFATK